MGFLGEFLGFDGRITRLGYLWRSIVAALGVGLLAAGAIAILMYVARPESLTGADVWMGRLSAGCELLGLWIGFALASRRLRDMGLEPVYIVPLFASLWVVNQALIEPLSEIEPQSFGLLENGWQALQWMTPLPLLFWPGRPGVTGPRTPTAYETAEPTQYLNWRQGGG